MSCQLDDPRSTGANFERMALPSESMAVTTDRDPTLGPDRVLPVARLPRVRGGPRGHRSPAWRGSPRSTTSTTSRRRRPRARRGSGRGLRVRARGDERAAGRAAVVGAYLNGFVTTDARDDEANALQSRLQAEVAPLRTLVDPLRGVGRATRRRQAHRAQSRRPPTTPGRCARPSGPPTHQMTEAEEGLAAELNLTGGSAWNRLHGDVTARLTAEVQGERLPITVVRNLAMCAGRGVRKAAYEAELAAWESVSRAAGRGDERHQGRRRACSTVGAAGPTRSSPRCSPTPSTARRSTRCTRRSSPSFPDFRRYLRAKARLLGHRDGAGLPWWDLFAPGRRSRRARASRGTRRRTRCSRRSPPTRPRSPSLARPRVRRASGSTPRRATASGAARSACRCAATRAGCS